MATKPPRGCWNCRDRKVACDRAIPSCENCLKRNTCCPGYGFRLSWPKGGDQRRSMRAGDQGFLPFDRLELQFINATAKDVEVSLGLDVEEAHSIRLPRLEFNILPPTPSAVDRSLSMGNQSVLSRMISGDDNSSDLHNLLLRMSLTDESLPTLAVRHSLTSLSILHTQGCVAARNIRGKALSAIRRCISGRLTQPNEVLQVISASLLMELYEIYSHESSANTWTGFFCGSKKLAKLSYEYNEAYEGDIALVLDWLFYHNIMYKFTMRHWTRRNSEQEDLAREPTIISKDLFSPKRHIIVPSLGCSLELLDTFSSVIDAVLEPDNPLYQSGSHQRSLRTLASKLKDIQQNGPIGDGNSSSTNDSTRVGRTANLFRLAISIYLERIANRASDRDDDISELSREALDLLLESKHLTQRFPLFVVALEAHSEGDRANVLRVFARQAEKVPDGLVSLRRMVEMVWVRLDLCDGWEGVDPLRLYSEVISGSVVPPAFT